MVLVQYKPTRSVLLQLRRTRRTAERGHKLLKLKQDALIVEFFRVLERAKAVRSNLVEKYKVAEARIAIARAIEGSIGVKSAAFALTEAPSIELKTEDVITAAEIETTMRRLIEEIEKVKRRVNALEYRVIPELKATEAFIRQRLEEMERDNFMRLKRFKST